jgi:hypothetical protein
LLVVDQKEDMKKTIKLLSTRKEIEEQGLVDTKPYSVVSEIYIAMNKGVLDNVHIPHSDVYFVRAALEKHTGYYFPLDRVEAAMKAEGWKDRKGIHRYAN